MSEPSAKSTRPRRGRGRRAARRAAGNAVRARRVDRRAVVAVLAGEAVGEFVGLRLADQVARRRRAAVRRRRRFGRRAGGWRASPGCRRRSARRRRRYRSLTPKVRPSSGPCRPGAACDARSGQKAPTGRVRARGWASVMRPAVRARGGWRVKVCRPRLKPNSGAASSATAASRPAAVEHDEVGRLAHGDAVVVEAQQPRRALVTIVEALARARRGVPTCRCWRRGSPSAPASSRRTA